MERGRVPVTYFGYEELDTVDMPENTSPGRSTAPECPAEQRDWHATEEHMGARELMKGDRNIPRKLHLRLQ